MPSNNRRQRRAADRKPGPSPCLLESYGPTPEGSGPQGGRARYLLSQFGVRRRSTVLATAHPFRVAPGYGDRGIDLDSAHGLRDTERVAWAKDGVPVVEKQDSGGLRKSIFFPLPRQRHGQSGVIAFQQPGPGAEQFYGYIEERTPRSGYAINMAA